MREADIDLAEAQASDVVPRPVVRLARDVDSVVVHNSSRKGGNFGSAENWLGKSIGTGCCRWKGSHPAAETQGEKQCEHRGRRGEKRDAAYFHLEDKESLVPLICPPTGLDTGGVGDPDWALRRMLSSQPQATETRRPEYG